MPGISNSQATSSGSANFPPRSSSQSARSSSRSRSRGLREELRREALQKDSEMQVSSAETKLSIVKAEKEELDRQHADISQKYEQDCVNWEKADAKKIATQQSVENTTRIYNDWGKWVNDAEVEEREAMEAHANARLQMREADRQARMAEKAADSAAIAAMNCQLGSSQAAMSSCNANAAAAKEAAALNPASPACAAAAAQAKTASLEGMTMFQNATSTLSDARNDETAKKEALKTAVSNCMEAQKHEKAKSDKVEQWKGEKQKAFVAKSEAETNAQNAAHEATRTQQVRDSTRIKLTSLEEERETKRKQVDICKRLVENCQGTAQILEALPPTIRRSDEAVSDSATPLHVGGL